MRYTINFSDNPLIASRHEVVSLPLLQSYPGGYPPNRGSIGSTMTKSNDRPNLVLAQLDVLLRMGTALFVLVSPDGILQTRCDELLLRMYPNQFRIVGPAGVPTQAEWIRLNHSIDSETGLTERPYQVLRKFMGLLSWPKILIINNTESFSADQVSFLSGCLTFQERDRPIDWPGSIILILKKNNYLSSDLSKFVRNVIGDDWEP